MPNVYLGLANRNLFLSEEELRKSYKETAEKYAKEAEILHSLKDCPNIIGYQDFCMEEMEDEPGWTIYIRMEFAVSSLLYSRPKTEAEAIKAGIDICSALAVCHRKDIIHRDTCHRVVLPLHAILCHDILNICCSRWFPYIRRTTP